VINKTLHTPWLASACRGGAVSTGVPAYLGLLADGPASLRRQTTAYIPMSARLVRAAAHRGLVSAEGAPASMAIAQQTKHDAKFANGGLRGPHPWRDPVKT
jgi:hypothetical protein